MNVCKGVCVLHHDTKNCVTHMGEDRPNYKRCKNCAVFIRTEAVYCPCCNFRLKTSPRNPKYRKLYREAKGIEGYE